ncbi:LysM peptidoglycan-binding domain-containing protein [Metabacillus bambusae]|uniref:LysM peptidoglycan-binding domain-containing protein n=1 Tax=Metabacillus bambusae TaxID=2795218 RepID=A0ABS3N769_9BACI|nr:LysM peptidoglycan-binding domain-containing protein [Metabacillus bambusae]MBO1513895.1 LysM peptidoglycan-binding domain-containing protein [Metabacillus bambusae]
MSEFDKRPDQAENLREKMIDDYKEIHGDYPPRGEVHKDKQKKKNPKMKYPLISILTVFFILVLIALPIYLYFGSSGDQSVTSKNSSGNETVYISKAEETDEEQDPVEIEVDSASSEEVEDKPVEEIETNNNDSGTTSTTETETETETDSTEKDSENQKKQDNTDSSTEKPTNDTDTVQSSETDYTEVKTHKVAAGETLFKIAIKYYKSRSGEEIIRQYNGIEANNIYEGQILKIPIK